jgi:SET domain-containing protein
MTPAELLYDVRTTRIRLGPSPIHGIGVFAAADIPAGTRDLFSPPRPWVPVPEAEVESLPPPARQLVQTYCLWDEGVYYLPPDGFRIFDLVMYLNHSAEPNLRPVNGGDFYETTRDVKAGEELTVDYGKLEV